MAVSVERGLTDRWRGGSNVVLLVRSPEAPDRLRSALAASLRDVAALGPAYLSPVIQVPDGALLIMDFGTAPVAPFRAVPDLLARRLTEAGIEDARIGTPARIGDRYSVVTGFAPAARAWLRGPLGVPLGEAPRGAERLLDVAVEWAHAAGCDHAPQGVVVSVEVALAWPTVLAALGAALATPAPVALVASDFRTAACVAAVEGSLKGAVKQATLTAAGAAWDASDVTSAMRGQRDVARAHAADLVWAGVDAVPEARDALLPRWTGRMPGGEHVPDLLVPDGTWFQVLSPGHIARLGGPPAGARPLDDGQVELTVGEPEQWLPGHPDRPRVQARARELLAACLVDDSTGMRLTRDRMAQARARDIEGFFPRR